MNDSNNLKRIVGSLVISSIPFLLYWISGSEFQRSGPMATTTLCAIMMFAFSFGYPGWNDK